MYLLFSNSGECSSFDIMLEYGLFLFFEFHSANDSQSLFVFSIRILPAPRDTM